MRAVIGALGVGVLAAVAAVAGSAGFVAARAKGHLYEVDDVPWAPVGLVLGAQVYPDGTPSPFLQGRLDLAQRLLDAGKIEVIVVSGDGSAGEYNEPDAMRRYLIGAGVPGNRIVADYAGFDTYDSCVRVVRIFGLRQVTVVTQSYHLPRAVATALLVGLDANGVGDHRAGRVSRAWWRGAVRDVVACVKTVIDVRTRRQPLLGPPQDSVTEALSRLRNGVEQL